MGHRCPCERAAATVLVGLAPATVIPRRSVHVRHRLGMTVSTGHRPIHTDSRSVRAQHISTVFSIRPRFTSHVFSIDNRSPPSRSSQPIARQPLTRDEGMRLGILASACCLLLISTSAAASPRDTTNAGAQRQWPLDQARPIETRIASKTAWLEHIARNSDFPLNKRPPLVLRNFVDSLAFTPKGLGSYSYLGLSLHLTTSEIHQVLSVFGAQETITAIANLRVSSAEHALAVRPASDVCEEPDSPLCQVGGGRSKTDHVCSNDGGGYGCNYSFGDICASSCGK